MQASLQPAELALLQEVAVEQAPDACIICNKVPPPDACVMCCSDPVHVTCQQCIHAARETRASTLVRSRCGACKRRLGRYMDVETMRKQEARKARPLVDERLRELSRDAESPTDMMWSM